MKPCALAIAAIALASSALAQSELRSRLRPITSRIQHAGVFHVATGTWTRNGSLSHVTGPDTIYNNSCFSGYSGSQIQGEKWQHGSRIPSPTGPTTDSAFYPGPDPAHEYDERPGCRTQYVINGFEFAYCSSKPSGAGTMTQVHQFASTTPFCGSLDLVPEVTFTITGLPGGTASGGQLCWVVGLDLDTTSASFTLRADGDGTFNNVGFTPNAFGWSFGPTSSVTFGDWTGPVIAGNFTWTGGAFTGPLTPCTGTDGTIWDSAVDLSEPGTGMSSGNFFRVTGTHVFPSGSGCYYFGGQPHADFYLKLFATVGADCPGDPMTDFCFPGQNGVVTCPCNNPPSSTGRGCNNFGVGPLDSAELSAFGIPSIGADTLTLFVMGENPNSTTIFLQGPSSSSTGVPFGAGVRCVAGNLKRLYAGPSTALDGAITRPQPSDPPVHVRSAALGDPLSPGSIRYYMTYYRDPNATGPCSSAVATFNSSNAGSITWQP